MDLAHEFSASLPMKIESEQRLCGDNFLNDQKHFFFKVNTMVYCTLSELFKWRKSDLFFILGYKMSFHKNTFYNKSKTAVKQNRRKIYYFKYISIEGWRLNFLSLFYLVSLIPFWTWSVLFQTSSMCCIIV